MFKIKGKARYLALPILSLLILNLFTASPVMAQGIGLSGNFYRQHFELSPGETYSSDDIYVIVSNHGDDPIKVKMNTSLPEGVILLLANDDFTLNSGAQQKIGIKVQVSPQAIPGEYDITVSAEAYREGGGIKITGGGQQQASLSILGESGRVIINAVTEEGTPFPAMISVYQEIDGEITEVRFPQKTKLEARLVPGAYLAQASLQDIKITEESFSLDVDEEKEITLVCYTLCIADFSVSPIYSIDDKLTSVKIAYTITNFDKPVNDVRSVLKVELDGKPLDETELTSFSVLEVGSRGGSYNYIPAQGWQEKSLYNFTIDLYAGNELRYQSSLQELTPGQNQSEGQAPTKQTFNWPVIGGIAGGVIVIGLFISFLFRRRAY